jgi:hypothetical protein
MYYLSDLGAKKKYKQSSKCPKGGYWGKRKKMCLDLRTGQPMQMVADFVPGGTIRPIRGTQPSQFDVVDEAGIEQGGDDFYPTDFSQAAGDGTGIAPYSSGGYQPDANTPGFYSEAQAYEGEAGGMDGLSAPADDAARRITEYRDIALDTWIKTQIALGKRVDPAVLAAREESNRRMAEEMARRSGGSFWGDSSRWTNAALWIGGAVAIFALYKIGKKKGWF